jgi:hypothetical protein
MTVEVATPEAGMDYGEDSRTPTNEETGNLFALVKELVTMDVEIADLEEQLKEAKRVRKELAEERIPAVMEDVGMEVGEGISLKDGRWLLLEEAVHTSITKANQAAAFKWLDENGHGGMIKRAVVVSFNRDQEEEARELQNSIRNSYPGVKEEGRIESSTLKAWGRQMHDEEVELPPSISVHAQKVAKIKKNR